MLRVTIISFILLTLFESCSRKEVNPEQINGRYVRIIDFEVPHPATGKKLGTGIIRDTIFISAKQDGYEVRNNKWRRNHYDTRGWQDLEHEENHPMPTYMVSFDPTDGSLIPVMSGIFLPIKLNLKEHWLQKGKNKRNIYLKLK
ncbi:hypothetical protein [Ohtaekwangia koreensis]|uniref:Uncharacterized protein n=1 Tax=Ohtaekwangia koreensis TaxID=688867 RepID=A0A1T5MA48_9BACT|nr:hypothetical protein [Ohtaekwangia koreensis]SKC85015.1 hypothetical protein SAMN05660236_4786 [Ohtaekwangia koreensis]